MSVKGLTTTSSVINLFDKNVLANYVNEFMRPKWMIQPIFKPVKTDRFYEKFNMWNTGQTGEITPLGENQPLPVYKNNFWREYQVTVKRYAYAMAFTWEYQQMTPDAKFKADALMAQIGDRMAQTRETDFANVFNNATSSTVTYADSKALLATDHPLQIGTFNNLAPAAFSEQMLNNARTLMFGAKDTSGNPIEGLNLKKILFNYNLLTAVQTVAKTAKTTGSNNNDVNLAATLNLEELPTQYLDGNGSFMLLTDIDDDLGFFTLQFNKKPEFFDTAVGGNKLLQGYVPGRLLGAMSYEAPGCKYTHLAVTGRLVS
jgi:hypothetical protein